MNIWIIFMVLNFQFYSQLSVHEEASKWHQNKESHKKNMKCKWSRKLKNYWKHLIKINVSCSKFYAPGELRSTMRIHWQLFSRHLSCNLQRPKDFQKDDVSTKQVRLSKKRKKCMLVMYWWTSHIVVLLASLGSQS